MTTLGDALPREMARVRDEVIPAYEACGPGGRPALFVMRGELDARAAHQIIPGTRECAPTCPCWAQRRGFKIVGGGKP